MLFYFSHDFALVFFIRTNFSGLVKRDIRNYLAYSLMCDEMPTNFFISWYIEKTKYSWLNNCYTFSYFVYKCYVQGTPFPSSSVDVKSQFVFMCPYISNNRRKAVKLSVVCAEDKTYMKLFWDSVKYNGRSLSFIVIFPANFYTFNLSFPQKTTIL